MRVAYFVSYLPPHVGGIEIVVQNELKALAIAGYDAIVVTSSCGSRPGMSELDGHSVQRVPAWNYFRKNKMDSASNILADTSLARFQGS